MKHQPHQFQMNPRLGRLVCTSCGLVALRNAFSDWCVRNGCEHEQTPGFAAQRERAGRENAS